MVAVTELYSTQILLVHKSFPTGFLCVSWLFYVMFLFSVRNFGRIFCRISNVINWKVITLSEHYACLTVLFYVT